MNAEEEVSRRLWLDRKSFSWVILIHMGHIIWYYAGFSWLTEN